VGKKLPTIEGKKINRMNSDYSILPPLEI